MQRSAVSDARFVWTLQGFTSNERYVDLNDRSAVIALQQGLGRADATCAALIPIRKSEAWWDLTQDMRRSILEECSHHIGIGLDHLPAVARRLHHCRDLGGEFDFLTWFEFRPDDADRFEEMVVRLRSTEEWSFVEREVDVRLHRAGRRLCVSVADGRQQRSVPGTLLRCCLATDVAGTEVPGAVEGRTSNVVFSTQDPLHPDPTYRFDFGPRHWVRWPYGWPESVMDGWS